MFMPISLAAVATELWNNRIANPTDFTMIALPTASIIAGAG